MPPPEPPDRTMESQQFLLQIAPECTDTCHFELRLDGEWRAFHVSLRLDAGRFVVNDMRGGEWGEGVWHDLPQGFDRSAPLLIHRQGALVGLFIGSMALACPVAPEAMPPGRLKAAGEGMRWHYRAPAQAAVVELSGESGRITAIRVARKAVALPSDTPPALALSLASTASLHETGYLRFLAAAGLPRGTQVVDTGSPALALVHAVLYPSAPVSLVTDASEAFAAIARANGLETLTTLTPDELTRFSPPAGSTVLVQGRDAASWAARLPGDHALHSFDPDQPAPLPALPSGPPALATPLCDAPQLDIVVALYNTRAHIRQCVESVLCNGRAEIGVIVVDDGSTDGSGDLVREAFADDSRVRLVRKANGGCASARNYGRLVSEAAHIAFVDADDWVEQGFFAGLYDLALATGSDMVQGGFDFVDEAREVPRWPYGGDLELADLPLESVAGMQAQRIPSDRLLRSQPTIWRKVYRRSFLDRRDIWFPESIRAYDDYLFHLLTLSYLPESWMLPGPKYLYRQHPDQDIRQGDTRHFNMLAMFSMLARRAQAEAWPGFAAHAQTMLDAIHWSSERLRPELVSAFLQAGAEVCVSVARCWGPQVMGEEQLATVAHPDFRASFDAEMDRTAALPDGVWWAQTTSTLPHPDTARMALSLKRSL